MLIFIIIVSIFGMIISYLVGYRFGRKSYVCVGNLHVETGDPECIHLFAELACPLDYVMEQEFVVMKIDTLSYLAQK